MMRADSGDFRFEFVTLKLCFASYQEANFYICIHLKPDISVKIANK